MSRRTAASIRKPQPDPVYHSELVGKFINHIMREGKKSVAEGIVYGAFEHIKKKTGRDPLAVFHKALDNVAPAVEVKSRRVGGATYQVPVEVRPLRKIALAIRWLIEFSKKRGDKSMMMKLAHELLDASDEEGGGRGKGGAVKKREDTHRMAEANKAFSHYRW